MSSHHLNELGEIRLKAEKERFNQLHHPISETDEDNTNENSKTNDEQNGLKSSENNNNNGESNKNSQKGKYPKIVFLIILTEFCERFSYYGIRTVLYIYLTSFVKQSKDTATVIYHAFTVICYFTPLFGAILADGYIGLYGTILYVSILYLVGEIILTLTSLVPLGAPNLVGPLIGLFIIAVGTGGIKPCVSAFGGNQFESNQIRYIETFFSIFYLSINIGSMIGTILTPILRSDVKCFGKDCFPLAFGIPATFMLISIIFFIAGTRFYKRNFKKSNGNVIVKTAGCISSALYHKISDKKNETDKKSHWLDYANPRKYDFEMIKSVKAFCRVIFVFLPIPIFWALYDQQGSRWTSQAQQLNGRVGSFTIKPDQFQAVNPLFIMFLVPLFDFVIYPFLARFNLLKRPLQRMSVGLFLAILSFVIAALLELKMQNASADLNRPNQIKVLNLSPCDLDIIDSNSNKTVINLSRYQYSNSQPVKLEKSYLDNLFKDQSETIFNVISKCDKNKNTHKIKVDNKYLPKTVILYMDESINNDTFMIKSVDFPYNIKNQVVGSSQLKISTFNLNDSLNNLKLSLRNVPIRPSGNIYDYSIINDKNNSSNNNIVKSVLESATIDYANYKLRLIDVSKNGDILLEKDVEFETCGHYTILMFSSIDQKNLVDLVILTDIYPNGLHLAWQLIQIFVMTVGEIMFSISGISFAYSQAPATMKSVLQAAWCMTVAIGNLVVVIIAKAKFVENQVYEYILFAGLLTAATIVFIIISYFYKYSEDVDNENDEESYKKYLESKENQDKKDQNRKLSQVTDITFYKPRGVFNVFRKKSVQDVTLTNVNSLY